MALSSQPMAPIPAPGARLALQRENHFGGRGKFDRQVSFEAMGRDYKAFPDHGLVKKVANVTAVRS